MKGKILHLIPSLSGGGAERQLSVLSARLHEHYFENHIGYLKEGVNYSSKYFRNSVLHKIDAPSNYSPAILCKLCRLIGEIKPDVIHTWIVQMDVLGGYAASVMGVPWLLREPNCAMAYDHNWKSTLRVATAKQCNGVVANSKQGLDYWKKRNVGVPLTVVRNGFDIERIDAAKVMEKEAFGLSDVKKTIIFAGRFEIQKNIEKLLTAFVSVTKDIDAQLVLCGDGPLRSDLKRWAGTELGHTVFLTGNIPPETLWGLIKTANIFCCVSTHEGMPNVVVEAGLCGAPLVVSDIPAHREILDESQAIFVDPRSTESIARGLRDVLENPDAARQRRDAARKHFEKFSVDAMVEKYAVLYEMVMGKK